MSLHDEIKGIVNIMMEHTDQIDRLDFFIRLRNGNIMKYHMDRRKEEKQIIDEKKRKKEMDKKMKKLEGQDGGRS